MKKLMYLKTYRLLGMLIIFYNNFHGSKIIHLSSTDNIIVGNNLNFEKIATEITNLRVLLESFLNQETPNTLYKDLCSALIGGIIGILMLYFAKKFFIDQPIEYKNITENEVKYLLETEAIKNILKKINQHLTSDKNEMINFLLYGPPGTGKTSIAKFIAFRQNAYFIDMSYSKIQGKFHGETAACQNAYFNLIKKLARKSLVVVLIDECEMACQPITSESNIRPNATIEHEINTVFSGLKTFLSMDGDSWVKNVCCILTTNSDYRALDDAIIRDGRMKAKIKIDYFSQEEQNTYIESYVNKLNIDNKNNLKTTEAIKTLQEFLPLGISIATINKICDDVSAWLNNKQKTNAIEEIEEIEDLNTKIHNSYLESTYGSSMIKNTDEKNNDDEKYKYFLEYQIYQLCPLYILDRDLFETKFIYLTNYWVDNNKYSYIYFDKNFSNTNDNSIIKRNFLIKIRAREAIETQHPETSHELIDTDIQEYRTRYSYCSFDNTASHSDSLIRKENKDRCANLKKKIDNNKELWDKLKNNRFIFKKDFLLAIKS